MKGSFERALFFVHRWAGIFLSLVIVVWFLSGLVTLYVGYPKLTPSERLAHLPALYARGCCISLDDAWRATGKSSRPRAATLTSIANKPVYIFASNRGVVIVDAVSGRLAAPVTQLEVLQAARAFLPGVTARFGGLVREDWWTVWSALEPHRPLYWVEMGDDQATRLYVSSVTGEVVLDATRSERRWNLVGPWLHWLLVFRSPVRAEDHWREVIIGLTLAALLLSVSGIVAGVMRWHFRGTYGSGRKTPYRRQSMRWHHIAGLLFGLVTVTWIFSGLMSIDPWGIFSGRESSKTTYPVPEPRVVSSRELTLDTGRIITDLGSRMRVRELEWPGVEGEPYLIARDGQGHTLLRTATGQLARRLPVDRLVESTSRLFPDVRVAEVRELQTYDSYFYARDMHTMRGHYDRRLPVVRIVFDGPDRTWVYVSPFTGAVLEALTPRQRVERWIFWFLHSWDSRWLVQARPLWDGIMIVLSAGGLFIGITGVIIGIRRLRSKVEAAGSHTK